MSPARVFEFATDPLWNRIVYGEKDAWIEAETNAEQEVRLSGPRGVDITTQGTLLVADAFNSRVALFSFGEHWLVYQGAGRDDRNLGVPVDVAWDGGQNPRDGIPFRFYVLDALGRVSYWEWYAPSFTLQWVYGSGGSATGQFSQPSGVCVGRALAANGGVRFTEDIYIADSGNRRLVWLRRGTNGPTWMGSRAIDQSGVPSDCTVDQFGNVIVADRQNNRLFKYRYNLDGLDLYGSYGRGANNLNTFSHPVSVHVPYGQRVSNGQVVYYGEGRVITAEDWTDSSGALEHWLGVRFILPTVLWGGSPWGQGADYLITDHANVTVDLMLGDAYAGTLYSAGGFKPSGWNSFFWDGTYGGNGGPPAAPGTYRFRITASSPYGCDGASWCRPVVYTPEFYFTGPNCDPSDPWCLQSRNVGLPLDGSITIGGPPTTFYMRQLVSPYVGPVTRLAAVSASVGGMADGDLTGRLSAEVRARGLTALSLGVPASAGTIPVSVRIYSLNGTLVRELVRESLEPDEYVVGWDARDRSGRPVLPGVYIAVMNAGTYRAVQRLIVPRN